MDVLHGRAGRDSNVVPEQDAEAIVGEQRLRYVAAALESLHQDPVTGLWYQVLDQPSRSGNYLEASASSMFVYAFAKGARRGLLDAPYRALAERGWDPVLVRSREEVTRRELRPAWPAPA